MSIKKIFLTLLISFFLLCVLLGTISADTRYLTSISTDGGQTWDDNYNGKTYYSNQYLTFKLQGFPFYDGFYSSWMNPYNVLMHYLGHPIFDAGGNLSNPISYGVYTIKASDLQAYSSWPPGIVYLFSVFSYVDSKYQKHHLYGYQYILIENSSPPSPPSPPAPGGDNSSGSYDNSSGSYDNSSGNYNNSSGTYDNSSGAYNNSSGSYDNSSGYYTPDPGGQNPGGGNSGGGNNPGGNTGVTSPIGANPGGGNPPLIIQATNLSLKATPKIIRAGKVVKIKGQLKDTNGKPIAGKKVKIKANGKVIKTVTTNANGQFSFKHKPKKNTTYQASFAGDGSYSASSSNSAKVKVKKAKRKAKAKKKKKK